MAYAQLIRVLAGSRRRRTCRRCRKGIVLVLDAQTKRWKPFDAAAQPLRTDEDSRGVKFDIYEPSAFHKCPKRKTAARHARASAPSAQEKLW